MLRLVAGLLLIGVVHGHCYAQPANLPQLRVIVRGKEAKKDYLKDSTYVDALNNLAFAYYRINADSLLIYCNKALAAARITGYSAGESNALRLLGNNYRLKGDYTRSLTCYHQALAIANRINNHGLIARASFNIALQYSDMGKLSESLAFSERAALFFAEAKDSLNLNKCIIAKGVVFYLRKQYDSALHYHRKALQLAVAMKSEYLQTTDYDAIGVVLLAQGRYKEALTGYLYSCHYFSHTDDKIRLSVAATMAAKSYLRLRNYHKALTYGLQGEQAAAAVKAKLEWRDAVHTVGEIYAALGDHRSAVNYMRQYNNLSDSLFNEQMLNNTNKLEAKYEYGIKEAALREQQAKKDAINRDIVRTRELEMYFAITVIVFLSVLAFILFRSRAANRKINQELEYRNREINRQKEEIEHQSMQLLQNNQQRDKLFGIIAHDLKTPLQSLKLTLDLLKEKALSEYQISRIMEELRQDADYSARLVGNLLSWANSQLKGIERVPVVLPVQQLTDDVLRQFNKHAADKNIDLSASLPPSLTAYADKDMVLLVLRNLVSNAIKFCQPGDAVTITGKSTANHIEICVEDTGIGIKSETLGKIKERRIVTTSGTANEKGTGLGMLLCREMVELNFGRLWIESEWQQGSRCFFTLPPAP